MFQPDTGRPSYGETDASGRYKLQYTVRVKGAEVGKHLVRISTAREDYDEKTGKLTRVPERLPARYHAKSDLNRDVKEGYNELNFELVSK